jgi:hypothetical protein
MAHQPEVSYNGKYDIQRLHAYNRTYIVTMELSRGDHSYSAILGWFRPDANVPRRQQEVFRPVLPQPSLDRFREQKILQGCVVGSSHKSSSIIRKLAANSSYPYTIS